jgi:hypothetical protein
MIRFPTHPNFDKAKRFAGDDVLQGVRPTLSRGPVAADSFECRGTGRRRTFGRKVSANVSTARSAAARAPGLFRTI